MGWGERPGMGQGGLGRARRGGQGAGGAGRRRGQMAQLVSCIHQNPKELGSNGNEGVSFPARVGASMQRTRTSFFHDLYIGCHPKMWPRFKVHLPTSNEKSRKIPYKCTQLLEF